MEHPYTLLHAIRKVSSRPARETQGVDKQTITTSSERLEMFQELTGLNVLDWNPPPVRRVYMALKADRKRWRPLGIPTGNQRSDYSSNNC